MKNKNASNLKLAAIAMTLLLMTACWEKLDKTLKIYQLIGTVAFVLAVLIYPFRHKISDFIKGNKKNIKFLLVTACMLFLLESRIFAQDISFEPAISTFLKICKSFARITAGTCGFYGLTRVGWLLVNEDHNCGTAFIMSIIGFFCCTIAVGLLPS